MQHSLEKLREHVCLSLFYGLEKSEELAPVTGEDIFTEAVSGAARIAGRFC